MLRELVASNNGTGPLKELPERLRWVRVLQFCKEGLGKLPLRSLKERSRTERRDVLHAEARTSAWTMP